MDTRIVPAGSGETGQVPVPADPCGPIREPVDQTLARRLREVVIAYRRAWCGGDRATLQVTCPAAGVDPRAAEAVHRVEPGDPDDHAVRTDVVAALLRRVGATIETPPELYVLRGARLAPEDLDVAWTAAAAAACAEAGLPMTLVVVTRRGWCDPRTGVRREWRRPRAR